MNIFSCSETIPENKDISWFFGLSYERPYMVLDLNSIMICMFFACV